MTDNLANELRAIREQYDAWWEDRKLLSQAEDDPECGNVDWSGSDDDGIRLLDTAMELLSKVVRPRVAAYPLIDAAGWRVGIVIEDEPGYVATTLIHDKQYDAQIVADKINAELRVSREEALAIVSSSMAASHIG